MKDRFEDHGIELMPDATGHHRTTCPECSPGRSKSYEKCLSVDADRGTWLCHHCGWKGGLRGFRPIASASPKPEERKYDLPTYKNAGKIPDKVRKWFEKRGITKATLEANGIGYGPSFGPEKQGVQFPFYVNGKVVNVKHRSGTKDFRQEKNAEKVFYNYDMAYEAVKESGVLIITEGEMDCLSYQEVGIKNVVSIPDGAPSAGSRSFTTKFDFLRSGEELLTIAKRVILSMDNDEPGRAAEKELVRRIGPEKCLIVSYPEDCKDANDILVRHGRETLSETVVKATDYPVDGLYGAGDFMKSVIRLYDQGSERGSSTGWDELDNYYTVKTGEMSIVTGIPGSGKSNFIDCLMINLARKSGWKFAVFSPENWPCERHIRTLAEKITSKPFGADGRQKKRMSKADLVSAVNKMSKVFRFIYPGEDQFLNVDLILEKARVEVARYGIKGLVIDPWNEIEHDTGALTEAQYLSNALGKIRRFARQYDIHIWVIAHPRNLVKDADGNYKPPTLYEISGGAHWRNKADVGICVHRPDYSNNITEVHIQKVRFREVGRIGSVEFFFQGDTGEYVENIPENCPVEDPF